MGLKIELRIVVIVDQGYEQMMNILGQALTFFNTKGVQLQSCNINAMSGATAGLPQNKLLNWSPDHQAAAIGALIEWGRSKGLSQAKLAKKIGIDHTWLSSLKTGSKSLGIATVREIIQGLEHIDSPPATVIALFRIMMSPGLEKTTSG